MNKFQTILLEAMNNADEVSANRGRIAQIEITETRGMFDYMASSPKWERCANGYITTDRKWVVTKRGNMSMMIGRNY